LTIAAILPREDPSDVFIAKAARTLSELPAGARVGTSSVRRKAQVLRLRPDLECVPLRGNVDTRLAKLAAGETDAILLAMAGLKRLGVADRVTSVLNPEEWLPSLAQGAVGIEIRLSDARTASLIGALDDEAASTELACERAFQAVLDGTCRTPIAGLARIDGKHLCFRGEVIAPDGSDSAATNFQIQLGADPRLDAARAGREAGTALRPRATRWLAL
jgi:hydroxymethylbilane synthase